MGPLGTVLTRDRSWTGWLHVAHNTTTRVHELPAARVVIPLQGTLTLNTARGTVESNRALALGAGVRCTVGCDEEALTIFFDLRSPEALALRRGPTVIEPVSHDRLCGMAREGRDSLLASGDGMTREFVRELGLSPTSPKTDRRVEEAVEWLEHHPFDPWSMTALAERVSLSPSRLAHLFDSNLGVSARTLARYHRTFGAVRELLSSGGRLSEIANLAGFSDQAHFARSMQHFFGQNASYARGSRNVQDGSTESVSG